jgi:hypothetical protein
MNYPLKLSPLGSCDIEGWRLRLVSRLCSLEDLGHEKGRQKDSSFPLLCSFFGQGQDRIIIRKILKRGDAKIYRK